MDAVDVPELRQIQNQVQVLKPSSRPLTDNDLRIYAESHSRILNNENKPFVVDFLQFDDEERFVIVWSTPKLIQVQNNSTVLATDATYKLSW